MSAFEIINGWQNQIGLQVQQLEFEGKSLGFKARLKLDIQFTEKTVTEGARLFFDGQVKAFAPFKSQPILEYQIQSRWIKDSESWRLYSWNDSDKFRKTERTFELNAAGTLMQISRQKVGEPKSTSQLSLSEARAKVQIESNMPILDPLTAIAFGMTRPKISAQTAAQFPFIFMLQKSGIKKIPVAIAGENLEIRFDQTEILFRDWLNGSYNSISVKDPRLPISVRLTRVETK